MKRFLLALGTGAMMGLVASGVDAIIYNISGKKKADEAIARREGIIDAQSAQIDELIKFAEEQQELLNKCKAVIDTQDKVIKFNKETKNTKK